MLIDTDGKIVFKGHPASRPDLEKDFDTLLKGERISGAGTEDEAKGGEEGSEKADAGIDKERDSRKDLEFIDKCANEVFPGLQKNEKIAAVAKSMPRAFCVFVYEVKHNVTTGKDSVKF